MRRLLFLLFAKENGGSAGPLRGQGGEKDNIAESPPDTVRRLTEQARAFDAEARSGVRAAKR